MRESKINRARLPIFAALVLVGMQPSVAAKTDKTDSTGTDTTKDQGDSSKTKDAGSTSSPNITVGSGTGVIESYMIANDATLVCAKAIAKMIGNSNVEEIILYDQAQHDALLAFAAFSAQEQIVKSALQSAIDEYDNLPHIPPEFATQQQLGSGIDTGLTLINSVVQTATAVAGLFKADVTLGGIPLTLDDDILIDQLSQQLIAAKPAVRFLRPSLYFSDLFKAGAIASSATVTTLTDLYKKRQSAQTRLTNVQAELVSLKAKLAATKDSNIQKQLNPLIAPRTAAAADLQGALAVFDALITKAVPATDPTAVKPTVNNAGAGNGDKKKDGAGGGDQTGAGDTTKNPKPGDSPPGSSANAKDTPAPPSIAAIVAAELLQKHLSNAKAGLLAAHIQQGGGGYETKSNLWTFLGGPRIYYSGGTVSTFALLNPDTGGVIASASCGSYKGSIRPKDIKSSTY